MNNYLKLEPDMGVLLNYCSIGLPHFFSVFNSPLWHELSKICKNQRAVSETFYLFGAFDLLNISISQDVNELDKIQTIKSYQKIKGVMDFFIHYGLIVSLYPSEFTLQSAIKENPLIGIINVKIRDEVWQKVYKKSKDSSGLKNFVNKLSDKVFADTINKYQSNAQDYKIISMLSYDCEDLIFIIFAKSYLFIKFFATNLRTIELNELMKQPKSLKVKHVTVSTNTIFGFNLKIQDNKLKLIQPIIDQNGRIPEKIRWYSFFKIRPGHLEYAQNRLKELSKNKIEILPIVGRNDLIASVEKAVSLSMFFSQHFSIMSNLSETRTFISSETYIAFPNHTNLESNKRPGPIRPSKIFKDTKLGRLMIDVEKSRNINKLEKYSFIHTIRKMAFLLDDRYLQDSFTTLFPIVFRGIKKYLNLGTSHSGPTFGLWTGLLELAYATRYQGSPPIGETAIYPTLVFYSLGQKIQILLDYLGNWIFKKFCESLGDDAIEPQYIVTININCPSGTIVPVFPLPISFIFLPPRPLFQIKILMLIFFHELGHAIFDSFLASQSITAELQSVRSRKKSMELNKLLRDLEETFAEFFSAKFMSNLNFGIYREINDEFLESLELKGQQLDYVKVSKTIDIEKAEVLYKYLKKNQPMKNVKKHIKINNDKFVSLFIKLLNSVANFDGHSITNKLEEFISTNKQHIKFWDLWMVLNANREACYYSRDTTSKTAPESN
jgi:hypothetical protein